MKKFKECDRCLDDVICDICGKSCKVQICRDGTTNIVNGVLKLDGCYGSDFDTTRQICDMCEPCFKEVMNFINSLGGEVRELHIGFFGECNVRDE